MRGIVEIEGKSQKDAEKIAADDIAEKQWEGKCWQEGKFKPMWSEAEGLYCVAK